MSSKLWLLPPSAKTALGRYRILSLLAGIRVSPLQLGAMSIGDQWDKLGMDTMDKEASFRLLDPFFDAGGNFIDTANNYQDETSEMFIGEWAEKRGIRDQLVIATKAYYTIFSSTSLLTFLFFLHQYTTDFKRADQDIKNKVNYVGNNAKSLKLSVEASLKKLRTSYINILYVHWWDWNTSIKEIMDNLHHLVVRGKVLYLGISDSPAWIDSAAHQYAMDHGKTPFVIYQGAWNVMERSFEREIIPVARSLGLAPAPWNVLAAGRLRSDAEEEKRLASGEKAALEKVAKEVGTEHVTAVAIEYLMQKTPYVFPIIGGRKVEQLMANIDALKISLSDEHIKYIESILPFDLGFPLNFIGDGTSERPTMLYEHAAHWDRWPLKQPIRISPAA